MQKQVSWQNASPVIYKSLQLLDTLTAPARWRVNPFTNAPVLLNFLLVQRAVTVCEGSDWTFRNLYRDDFQGQFIARYIDEILTDLQSVAVFFDNDDYGRGLRNAFVAEAEKSRS